MRVSKVPNYGVFRVAMVEIVTVTMPLGTWSLRAHAKKGRPRKVRDLCRSVYISL